jgi:predicted nucleotidyltransferase
VHQLIYEGKHAPAGIGGIVSALRALGPTAVFGGVLRDLCRGPVSKFSSDIDLVVLADREVFEKGVAPFRGTRTRYGGFRILEEEWTVDVWPLQDTWAFRHGHVRDRSFRGLIETTFFNWDALVLELESQNLYYGDSYFEQLESRLLEINLEPNANPPGNVGRTLRYLVDHSARLGPRLSRYVADFLGNNISDAITRIPVEYMKYLDKRSIHTMLESLQSHVSATADRPFEMALPSPASKRGLF